MNPEKKSNLIAFLMKELNQSTRAHPMRNDESLFLEGPLNSLNMMNLVVFLEDNFNLDFSNIDFSVELVDTIDKIEALVETVKQ
jgi:acyl carrier protein